MFHKIRLRTFAVVLLTFFLLDFGWHGDVYGVQAGANFSLMDLSGKMRSLSEYKGRVVILDFWATWCLPCRMSIPKLVELQERYREKGLVVLGISVDDPQQATDEYLRAFKEKFEMNYTVLRHNTKVMADYFGNGATAIPTMFLVDREGKVRDKIVGFRPGALEKSLENIL